MLYDNVVSTFLNTVIEINIYILNYDIFILNFIKKYNKSADLIKLILFISTCEENKLNTILSTLSKGSSFRYQHS